MEKETATQTQTQTQTQTHTKILLCHKFPINENSFDFLNNNPGRKHDNLVGAHKDFWNAAYVSFYFCNVKDNRRWNPRCNDSVDFMDLVTEYVDKQSSVLNEIVKVLVFEMCKEIENCVEKACWYETAFLRMFIPRYNILEYIEQGKNTESDTHNNKTERRKQNRRRKRESKERLNKEKLKEETQKEEESDKEERSTEKERLNKNKVLKEEKRDEEKSIEKERRIKEEKEKTILTEKKSLEDECIESLRLEKDKNEPNEKERIEHEENEKRRYRNLYKEVEIKKYSFKNAL